MKDRILNKVLITGITDSGGSYLADWRGMLEKAFSPYPEADE